MAEGWVTISPILRFGRSPSPADVKVLVNDLNTGVFVNLKKETGYTSTGNSGQLKRYREQTGDAGAFLDILDSSRYYEHELSAMGKRDEVKVILHPTDGGMENDEIFKLAKGIVKEWKRNISRAIYIHNRDGLKEEATLAFTVYALMSHKPDFKPLDWLQKEGHYEVCIQRTDKDQLIALYKRAGTLSKWDMWLQPPKKKTKTNSEKDEI